MLEVIDPGFMTTVQDLGRWQALRFGVPVSGAMDRFAIMAANHLVGNPWDAAGLECYAEGALLTADQDLLVAGSGAGYSLIVGICSYPLWMAVFVPRGEIFGLRNQNTGRWGYLAISGGVNITLVMGSRSTYLRIGLGGLEGRVLRFGDHLPAGSVMPNDSLQTLAGRSLPRDLIPQYTDCIQVEIVPASQFENFTAENRDQFLENAYTISNQSDRMGYRLQGKVMSQLSTGDILSEGAVPGTVQIPADGQPVVLLSDAQTTGGYAKIGVIANADLGRFVQCPIGSGQVCFSVTTVTLAQERWKKKLQDLKFCRWDDENQLTV